MSNEHQTLVRIYRDTFKKQESKSFDFAIKPQYKRIVGVLFSASADVTLSLTGNNCIAFEGLEYAYNDESTLPPNKRLIEWKQDITEGQRITGKVTNLKTQHQFNNDRIISVYLMLEEDEK